MSVEPSRALTAGGRVVLCFAPTAPQLRTRAGRDGAEAARGTPLHARAALESRCGVKRRPVLFMCLPLSPVREMEEKQVDREPRE